MKLLSHLLIHHVQQTGGKCVFILILFSKIPVPYPNEFHLIFLFTLIPSMQSFGTHRRTIVAIMISINTLATHYLVQDEINGLLVAGDYHTLLEIGALFYIIQCPGSILLYFLCHHKEDFQYGYCDFFNLFVFLVTILQNWVCMTMIYYIYFL
jgi:hypothetical protein